MSEIVYFKKLVPQTSLVIFNGTKRIDFPYVGLEPGYIATNKKEYIDAIDQAIKAKIGGVERATKEEYDVFMEKKSLLTGSPRIWREEFGRSVPLPKRSKGQSKTSPAAAAPAATAKAPTAEDIASAAPEVEHRPE